MVIMPQEIDELTKDEIKEVFSKMVDVNDDIEELKGILNICGHKGLLNKI